jgi:predicted hydrolase (HD superfamily)
MIAVGAIMKELALRLGEDQKEWELTGILHDIDFEECDGLRNHTILAKGLLSGKVDDAIIEAIMAHNHENTGVAPDTKLKKALIASDAASGLIVAAALVMPSKKLADVKDESLMKKFKTKEFARGCDRERMMASSELGFSIEGYMSIALEGMKKASAELGL